MAKLYFKYGAMGSSKTATALITKYNYEERGMKVWLIKPSADERDGQFILKSRIGLISECEAIPPATDIRALYAARPDVDEPLPFEIGDKIAIIPNHACVLPNLVDKIYGIRNGRIERMIPIEARGRYL